MGCEIKSNCMHLRPGHAGKVPLVGAFLRHSSPYLSEFRKNHGEIRTTTLTRVVGVEPVNYRPVSKVKLLRKCSREVVPSSTHGIYSLKMNEVILHKQEFYFLKPNSC